MELFGSDCHQSGAISRPARTAPALCHPRRAPRHLNPLNNSQNSAVGLPHHDSILVALAVLVATSVPQQLGQRGCSQARAARGVFIFTERVLDLLGALVK